MASSSSAGAWPHPRSRMVAVTLTMLRLVSSLILGRPLTPSFPSVSSVEAPTPSSRMPWIPMETALPWPNTTTQAKQGTPRLGDLQPCWGPGHISPSALSTTIVFSDFFWAPPDCLLPSPEAPPPHIRTKALPSSSCPPHPHSPGAIHCFLFVSASVPASSVQG